MAAKGKQKNKQSEEIWENPEVLADKISTTEKVIKENSTTVTIAFIALIVIAGGLIGWKYWTKSQNEEAQAEMYQSIYYFEQDSLQLALRGDGNNLGFAKITELYPNTDAGNLANFYSGVIYLRQQNFNSAILYLKDFSSSDLLLQARAYSLIGDAYSDWEKPEEALEWYEKAAAYKSNDQFTPIFLQKLAVHQEALGNKDQALESYKSIVEDYPESDLYDEARKHVARLEGFGS